jgi:ABC-type lipoprotein release transport system permease subunit
MSSLLLDVVPLDLPTFLGFALLLLVVAAVASYLPAVRATKADPMEALR